MHYFLNLIHWRWINWQADEDRFVNLKYDYLTKVIDKSIWTKLRQRLEVVGVIECDGLCLDGVKSYGYRLCDRFRKTHRIVCQNDSFSERVLRFQRQRDKVLLPVHYWLRSHLDLLDFDMAKAREIVSTKQPEVDSSLNANEYQHLLTDICERFVNRDQWLIRDRFGRVHTPVNSLPKELRSCLSVRGQPLIGVDLSNSQPLIAGICARQFYRNRTARSRLANMKFAESGKPYRYREFADMEKKAFRTLSKNASARQCNPGTMTPSQDLQAYLQCCEFGKLYDSLMEPGADRQAFKKQFFTDVFFGKNRWQSPLKQRFEEAYPSVAQMLHRLKEKDHRRSAWVMQCYESTIFIYIIGKRLSRECPDLPVYSIHDSILTVPEGIDFVEGVIRDEFAKIDVHPTLRRESY